MVRSGKEHAAISSASAAVADDATTQDTRWLNGINRQLRPDAASQRQALHMPLLKSGGCQRMRRQQQTGPMRIVGTRLSVRNVRQPIWLPLQQPTKSLNMNSASSSSKTSKGGCWPPSSSLTRTTA